MTLREELADLCHRQWSGWMRYLFDKSFPAPDGTCRIPAWAFMRWQKQMNTQYSDLSPEEKDNDREEADKFLALFSESNPWTHVLEGLPEPRQRVQTFRPSAPCDWKIDIHRYVVEELDWWLGSGNYLVEDMRITHWRPLPEEP